MPDDDASLSIHPQSNQYCPPSVDAVTDRMQQKYGTVVEESEETIRCERMVAEYCEEYDLAVEAEHVTVVEIPESTKVASSIPVGGYVVKVVVPNEIHISGVEGGVINLAQQFHHYATSERNKILRHELAHVECFVAEGLRAERHDTFRAVLDRLDAPRSAREVQKKAAYQGGTRIADDIAVGDVDGRDGDD